MNERLFTHSAPVRAVLRKIIGKFGLGSYRYRCAIGALNRAHYAYIIYQAAQLAAKLGLARISILEFGVASGNGMISIERHAAEVERIFPVKIEIYGFDTGAGLPERKITGFAVSLEARVLCHGPCRLESRLKRSKLIFGDIADTWRDFAADADRAPIGAVIQDMDFYSSTRDALQVFEIHPERLLPRVFCYFDDTIGSDVELYSEYVGQRLAIAEYNSAQANRKLGTPFYLRSRQALGSWVNQIWVLHSFDHPLYNQFVSTENQQIALN